MIKTYYMLTKPGIIFGNIVTTAAGLALASKGHIDILLFFWTLLGLAFIIGSACVFNNYLDRDIDEKMDRTRNRPFVLGTVSVFSALLFAASLGLMGFFILLNRTNTLTASIAAVGFFVYTVLYTIWKLRSIYGTLVGSIAGAVPPVVGYCAVSGRFDMGAFILFMIVTLWQMPHFFAIAMYRFDDYAAASIPVLPVKRGMAATKQQTLLYIIGFTCVSMLLTLTGYMGWVYFAVVGLLGISWFGLGMQGFRSDDDIAWGRKMFRFSLVTIMAISAMIPLDVIGSSYH